MTDKNYMCLWLRIHWKQIPTFNKQEFDIEAKVSCKQNPQSNAILERIHQTIGNMVHPFNQRQDS
jgi:hypothetical protein